MRSTDELLRKAIDGELSPAEAVELKGNTGLERELGHSRAVRAALRELKAPRPRADFTARVMSALPHAQPSLAARLWAAIVAPRSVNVSFGQLAGACAGLAALLVLVPRAAPHRAQPASLAAAPSSPLATPASFERADDLVPVRFVVMEPEAKDVTVAGDFNGWKTDSLHLVPSDEPGVWTVTVKIPRGRHKYMFVVDGNRWETDPLAEEHHRDGFGHENAVIDL